MNTYNTRTDRRPTTDDRPGRQAEQCPPKPVEATHHTDKHDLSMDTLRQRIDRIMQRKRSK